MTAVTMPASRDAQEAWIDRLLEGLQAWRWPLPVTFGVLAVATIVVLHLVEWSLGGLPPGELDPFIATLPAYPLGVLAVIAVQNRTVLSALDRFRPATGLDDDGYRALSFDLTHQPPLGALVSGLAFGTMGVLIEATKDGAPERLATYPIAFAINLGASFAFYAPAGPFIMRTVRLLRRVHQLHQDARSIDLLDPGPAHAFSSVTALVGISFIAITSLSLLTDPATHQTAGGALLTAALLGSAVACFVVPLWGMHRRLQQEQARLAADVARRIQATIERLYEHVDQDRPGATELRDRMTALLAARDLINRASTWPWQPETPRWLFSALLVPVAIWAATRFLERALL